MLDGAKAGSLVLMDEMGSGTDPMQGAALAQSLLEVTQPNADNNIYIYIYIYLVCIIIPTWSSVPPP